ncbi:3-oxoacyl-[acyl-carrier-protein] reductase [Paenibacillus sambharensis]|uniref:3-oxoacyl-[acyl-carrier-protein] reductase n=1 Tax=Paenibacillus sambharensis TaxID=1803190 RepID=A0A2W1LN68_9BACL|nr:SDR family NAD(P)-dependent oxidoreductase [Paenibacillus sambharensis]PZD96335.1 3-oxoacyl-[acyl-carrier-protein] reductase [Paenibacillus sambharensis]
MNSDRLEGKVAVVTGGGSGIGQAAAVLLADRGASVALLEYDQEHGEEAAEQLRKSGARAMSIGCDIAEAAEVERAYAEVVRQWGRLDIVFANAGIAGKLSPIETMEPEEWDRTIRTNLRGTFLTLKYAIPHMKTNGGSIIITSSVSGNRIFSQAGFTAYSTTKAGQTAMMKMAALELARYGIRVNAICPGGIKTGIGGSIEKSRDLRAVEVPLEFPEGAEPLEHRPGTAEEVAELVYFLATARSRHITGTEIYIDGAESLLRG